MFPEFSEMLFSMPYKKKKKIIKPPAPLEKFPLKAN